MKQMRAVGVDPYSMGIYIVKSVAAEVTALINNGNGKPPFSYFPRHHRPGKSSAHH